MIKIGKIVDTHALKGEIRIISSFDHKDLAFAIGNKLIINENEYTIKTYRKHKNYDMVTLEGIDDILDAKKLVKCEVYISEKYFDSVILDIDLIGVSCYYNNEIIGKVAQIVYNNGYKLFVINDKYIPYNDNFIVSLSKEKIVFKNLDGIYNI